MKKLDTKSLRRSVIVYVAISMLILIFVTAVSTLYIKNYRQAQKEKEYTIQIHHSIEHVVKHYFEDYRYSIRRLLETTEIVDIIKSKDREKLYTFLKPKWDLMKEEEKYLNVMQIHLPDGTSFLRMHMPNAYGDELASVRPMIKEIHTKHKMIAGYETGKHTNVYRIISPIFDEKQNYIGAIELGLNPNFIVNAIRKINGFCGMIFIKEESLKLHSIKNDIVVDGYKLQSELTPELKEICGDLEIPNYLKDGIYIKVKDKRYVTHLFVLNDFKKQAKVKIIFFQDISEVGIFRSYLLWGMLISLGIVFSILIWFIYRRLNRYQNDISSIYLEQIQKINNAEHELSHEKNKLENIFNAMKDGIYVVSENYDIEYVNQVLIQDFGDYHGQKCYEYFHDSDEVCCSWCKNSEVHEGKTVHWERYSDKNDKTYDIIDTPIENSDGTVSKLEIFRDITKNKRMEEKNKFNEKYLQSVFDVTPNIMITSDGIDIDKVNHAMLKFFNYETIEDFKKEHQCICDFFLSDKECLQSEMKGMHWLEYALLKNDEQHYVCMMKNSKRYHFIVHAHYLDIDDKNRSVVVFSDITEQKELEEELRSSKQQFELFMEYMPASVLIKDENLRILYANTRAKSFCNGRDIIGLKSEDILSADDVITANKVDNDILEKGHIDEIEELTNYNNEKFIYRTMGFVIQDEKCKKLGIVVVDITKEYQAQYEISKLKSALERSPVSIMSTDIYGNIEYINPNYTKVSGYSLDELIGKNPSIVKSGYTSNEKYKEMWEQISSGHIWSSDIKNIAKDGSEFWEDSTIIPSFDEAGEVNGYIAFKLEITQQKYLEKELADKDEIMIAQSRHAAMGEMISMIAHQWRQPISVIAMDANNILADIELEIVDENTLKSGAEDIIAQTQELSKTIDDFRNFFRPERMPEEVMVADIINEAMGVIGKSLENNNIDVILELGESKEIKTYSRELMQVFINIIKNAKEVLVEKEIAKKKISIILSEDTDGLIFNICDNGGGIDKEIIDKIFDPYFTTKGEKNGTGLGLYMSRTIVEKHLEGRLEVENIADGVCFTIKIPHAIKGRDR